MHISHQLLFLLCCLYLIITNSSILGCTNYNTCSSCLSQTTANNGTACAWCSLTSTCVYLNQRCLNVTIHLVGHYGLVNKTIPQRNVLSQCHTRLDNVNQCVTGMDYAHIYMSVSDNVRNMREGGLEQQPLLPLTQEFLNTYVSNNEHIVTSDMSKNEFINYVERVAEYTEFIVGAYVISGKRTRHEAIPYSIFFPLAHTAQKGNLTLSQSGTDFTQTNDGQWILNIFTTNLGMEASPGHYNLGMVLATMNTSGETPPVCMFYQIPHPIRVTTVVKEMLVAVYLLGGIPLYFISFIILCIFAKMCPWAERKSFSQRVWEQKEKKEDNYSDSINDNMDDETELKSEGDVSMEQISIGRKAHFSLKRFWSLDSKKIISQCGFPAYYHWKFYRRMILIVGIFSIVTIAILLPLHIVFGVRTDRYMDFAVTTVASIPQTSRLLYIHYGLSVFYFAVMAINLGLTIKLIYYKKRQSKSIFTARITNLPVLELELQKDYRNDVYISNQVDLEKRESRLTKHFNALLDMQVNNTYYNRNVTYRRDSLKQDLLTVDTNELAEKKPVLAVNALVNMTHLVNIIDQKYQLTSQISSEGGHANKSKKNLKRIAKLEQVKHKLIKHSQRSLTSNSAFVTFRSVKALRKVVDLYSKPNRNHTTTTKFSEKIGGNNYWKIRETQMEPEDILWENIGYSLFSNVMRTISVYTVSYIIGAILSLLVSVYIITNGMYGLALTIQILQTVFMSLSTNSFRRRAPFLLRFVYYILPTLLAVLNEVFAFIVNILTKFEKMKTITKYQASYLLKTITIMLLTSLLLPYFGDYQIKSIAPIPFYNNSGLKLMQFLLSQLFFSKALVNILDIVSVIFNYWWTKGEPNRLQFVFVASYSKALMVFFTIVGLGPSYPLLFIPGFFFFVINYLADTFLLSCFYEKSTGAGDVEFAITTIVTFYFSASSVLMSPALQRKISYGLSGLFVVVAFFVTLIMLLIVYIVRRKATIRNEQAYMHNEEAHIHQYEQPHLQLLLKQ
jgi:hypothetical protein